jgi:chromosome segregation ATPase
MGLNPDATRSFICDECRVHAVMKRDCPSPTVSDSKRGRGPPPLVRRAAEPQRPVCSKSDFDTIQQLLADKRGLEAALVSASNAADHVRKHLRGSIALDKATIKDLHTTNATERREHEKKLKIATTSANTERTQAMVATNKANAYAGVIATLKAENESLTKKRAHALDAGKKMYDAVREKSAVVDEWARKYAELEQLRSAEKASCNSAASPSVLSAMATMASLVPKLAETAAKMEALQSTSKNVVDLRSECESHKHALSVMERGLESQKRLTAEASAAYADLKQEKVDAKVASSQVCNEHVADLCNLRHDIKKANAESEALQIKLTAAETDLSVATGTAATSEVQIHNLMLSLKAADALADDRSDELYKRIGMYDTVHFKCVDLGHEIKALTSQVKEATARNDALQLELIAAASKASDLTSHVEEATAQYDALQIEWTAAVSKASDLTSQVEEATARNDELALERDSLNADLTAANHALTDVDNELAISQSAEPEEAVFTPSMLDVGRYIAVKWDEEFFVGQVQRKSRNGHMVRYITGPPKNTTDLTAETMGVDWISIATPSV